MRRWILFNLVFWIAIINGGGCNLFQEVSDKTSDEAIIYDINMKIDQKDWLAAINRWADLSSARKEKRDAMLLLATAWAGYGGQDIIAIISAITTNSAKAAGSRSSFFKVLMTAFTGKQNHHYEFMRTAQTKLFLLSTTPSARTTDENIFSIFLQLTKLGVLVASRADMDNDGVVDTTFQPCRHNYFDNIAANEIIAAIAQIITTVGVVGSSIFGTSLDALNTACTTLATEAGISFCNTLTPDSGAITDTARKVARTLVAESALGLGLSVDPGNLEVSPGKTCQ